MIKNQNEYEFTLSSMESFEERKVFLTALPYSQNIEIEIDAINEIVSELKQQLELYQAIKSGRTTFHEIESMKSLPIVLVGRRLQLNISQEEMAKHLGLSFEEYIRLENDDFFGIEPIIFQKMIKFLNLENPQCILDRDYNQVVHTVETNLESLNIKPNLLPINLKEVKSLLQRKPSEGSHYVEKIIEFFKRVFSISVGEESNKTRLLSDLAVAFKHKINVDKHNLTITTGYAAYIAGLLLRQWRISDRLSPDPILIRRSIIDKYDVVDFDSCVDFIWNIGIAVIPINIKGSFHGACFNFEEKKAIVLSQQYKSISRWKFDLLHELYHALTMDNTSYIERTEIMYQQDEQEKKASEFACFVVFGQEMDSYLQMVIERSNGQAERIKSSISAIAKKYGIEIGDFANYVAFRISKTPLNFWGVAENLQTDKRDPMVVLLKHLYQNITIGKIDSFEFNILQNAINEGVTFNG